MKKKIKISLGAKVFLLTFLLLLFCSLALFFLISLFTPRTYSAYLTDSLNEKVSDFLSKTAALPYKESGGLFELLLRDPEILSLTLLDDAGKELSFPWEEAAFSELAQEEASVAVTEATDDFYENASLQSYDISFADKPGCTLLVYGNAQPVSQLREAFKRLFPFLLFIFTLVSLVFSLFYSRIVINLQKDIEKEKQLEKERQAFFSAASHELKTPVTIIKGQLEGMLLNVGVYKDREKYLARALEVANTLETMIQQLLISSHLDAADYRISLQPVNLSDLTKECLSLSEDLLAGKELTVHADMDTSLLTLGDKSLLEKALGNLISNAVYYSPKGSDIFITLKRSGSDALFQIENTGVHIPDDVLPKIFEPFYRGEQSRSRQTGGSGLGLSIVQKILQIHESRCSAENTREGVRFSFRVFCQEK
ncbi:MAG: ATP-binding protein [Clostridium sp.]|nr:ATP-binding protein [Clostridium sp.]